MFRNNLYKYIGIGLLSFTYTACKLPGLTGKSENKAVPASYNESKDTVNIAQLKWKNYFTDPDLVALIDSALKNNQELNITLQEIEIARNEVRARKGEYLPFVGLRGGAATEKVGRYTSQGAGDASTEMEPGRAIPDPLPDFLLGAYATWEVDIWKKLRNAKKAAVARYLSSIEGKNFVITNLVAEVANSYYELLALDNQLDIIKKNIDIQNSALEIVRLQKLSAKVTELAVRKFEAEVLKTSSLQYEILQQITETENRINFLLGRVPQPIRRNRQDFETLQPRAIQAGIPSQLLENRPDVKEAELQLAASKLDVKVARAQFYPSLGISGSIGARAFDPSFLLKMPESMLYSLAGDLMAPLINRNAIKATYYSANAKQIQAIYNYERTVLKAYLEVSNQLAKVDNLGKSYALKSKQVEALTQSIDVSTDLFKASHADYMEVLLTQRDALESKFELIETKKQQMQTVVNIYEALGGGWK